MKHVVNHVTSHNVFEIVQKGKIFRSRRAGTQEELLHVAVLAINNQLDAWYKRRHQDRPAEKLTRITKLTKGKLGKANFVQSPFKSYMVLGHKSPFYVQSSVDKLCSIVDERIAALAHGSITYTSSKTSLRIMKIG